MGVADAIREKLEAGFAPTAIEVIDESARHRHHAGGSAHGETHFRVRMVSPAFDGMSRVARSRAVHKALEAEFAAGLHALALELKGAAEA